MKNSTQKQIIVLKTDDSRLFEEAHLILREDPVDCPNIVLEANRIVARAEAGRIYGKRTPKSPLLPWRLAWFFGGMCTTVGIAAITALLMILLF